MTKKKFYAVRQGRQPGIYTTWDDCRRQVTGFPNAVFKGFAELTEAQNFLNSNPQNIPEAIAAADSSSARQTTKSAAASNRSPDSNTPVQAAAIIPKNGALAYVDGSYDHKSKDFSCGVVLLLSNEEKHFSQRFHDPVLAEMRNVAGEIKGAEKAMQLCLELKLTSLVIYHDYQGIASWCTGDWQAKKAGTQAYKAFYDRIKPELQVRFVKVTGHSGDHYNDLADRLARSALNL